MQLFFTLSNKRRARDVLSKSSFPVLEWWGSSLRPENLITSDPDGVEVLVRSVFHPTWVYVCVRFHVTAAQTPISGVSLGVAKSSSAMAGGRSNRVDNTSTCRNRPACHRAHV